MNSPVLNLSSYKAILFDMNETFMFDGDRLGTGEDFYATYRAIGGSVLSEEAVAHYVSASVTGFIADYTNPALIDDFPSLRETIGRYTKECEQEIQFLEFVIAKHEVGVVPEWAAQVILSLARSHRLGIVSNVWAPSHHWKPELCRSGVTSAFECQIFSSDGRSVKPSQRLFLEAIRKLSVAPQEILFVGDSLERDIVPAKLLGMKTCLVAASDGCRDVADFCITSIAALTMTPNPALERTVNGGAAH